MNKEQELRAMSGRLRIIAATLDPTEFDKDSDYEEVKRSLIGTADGISAKASRFALFEDEGMLDDLAGGPGGGMPPETAPMAGGEPPQQEPTETPGRYDPARQPTAPLWNITINRIRAGTSDEAHNIVKDMVDKLVSEGHTMAAVGLIQPANDKLQAKSQG